MSQLIVYISRFLSHCLRPVRLSFGSLIKKNGSEINRNRFPKLVWVSKLCVISFELLNFFCQLRNDLKSIAHNTVIRNLEERRIGVSINDKFHF